MNYFEIFDLTVDFDIDQRKLKQAYLKLSKKYHPDFSTLENEKVQEEMLKQSALINEAYKVLENEDLRLEYILILNGLLDEAENKKLLPESFLFEILELNEEFIEIKSKKSSVELHVFKEKINDYIKNLKSETQLITKDCSDSNKENSKLNHLLVYYLKMKYLQRLIQQVNSD